MKTAFGPKRSKGFRDKYLAPAMIVAALLLSFCSHGQYDSTKTLQRINAYGYDYPNVSIRGMFRPPSDTLHLAQAQKGAISVVNNVLYTWSGIYWTPIQGIGSGGTLDSIRVPKRSGYVGAFSLDDLGDNDWITKQIFIDGISNLGSTASYGPTLTWPGFPEPVDVDTLDWIGTKYQDSIHTSRIDSVVANWPTGGGSAFGDTVAHDITLTGRGIVGNVLKADTNKITSYVNQRIDSIVNNSVGVRSIITAGTNVAVTGAGTAPSPYVISAAITGGNPLNALSIVDFGGVKNSSTTSSRNANYAAFNSMITAAKDGQVCIIPDEDWYFPASALVMSSTTKKINLLITGDIWFPAGANSGFILEGNYHYLTSSGDINGGNSGALDSTGYAAYLGTGIYLRNCDKCLVNANLVENFKYGIKYGGESTTTAKGTQYGRIWFGQIRNNFADIYITTTGTTTDGSQGNWATSGFWYGGQLGRHTLGHPGVEAGVYGILVEKDASSNQGNGTNSNPFNYHQWNNIGFEGMMVGMKATKLWYSTMFPGRNETNAVDSFLFDLRESTAGGLECKDNDFSRFPGVYETSFRPGGRGNGTVMPPLLDSGGTRSAFFAFPNGSGNYINVGGSKPTVDRSLNDLFYIDHFPTAYSSETHALYLKRRGTGVEDYVSFDGKYKTVTTSTYTVENQYSTIYGNGTGAQTFTLPAAASFPKKIINIKNKSGTYTITVNGVAANNTASLAPYMGCLYESDGTSWYAKVQVPTTTGGGGSGDLWDSIGVGKISYNGLVGIGFTGAATAVLELSAGNTTRPALVVGEGQLTTVPKNNAFENYQTRQYFTSGSIRREFMMAPAAGGAAKQYLRWPTSGTALEYVYPDYSLIYNSNAEKSVTATTATTMLNGGAITLPHAIDGTNTIVIKGAGFVINGGSTHSLH
jgi:hypothetical protein